MDAPRLITCIIPVSRGKGLGYGNFLNNEIGLGRVRASFTGAITSLKLAENGRNSGTGRADVGRCCRSVGRTQSFDVAAMTPGPRVFRDGTECKRGIAVTIVRRMRPAIGTTGDVLVSCRGTELSGGITRTDCSALGGHIRPCLITVRNLGRRRVTELGRTVRLRDHGVTVREIGCRETECLSG